MLCKTLAFGFIFVLSGFVASAQTGQASLNGVVKDSTGAIMPGVAVSIANQATNVVRSTVSNQQGIYSLPALPPGTYRLSAGSAGFRTLQRDGVQLRVDDRIAGLP